VTYQAASVIKDKSEFKVQYVMCSVKKNRVLFLCYIIPSKVSVFVITLRLTAGRKCYIFCYNNSEKYCRLQYAFVWIFISICCRTCRYIPAPTGLNLQKNNCTEFCYAYRKEIVNDACYNVVGTFQNHVH
jgi:hypothetical protein